MSNQHVSIAVGSTNSSVYHTNQDCPNIPEQTKLIAKEVADAHGKRPCRFCTDRYEVYEREGRCFRQLLESGEVDV